MNYLVSQSQWDHNGYSKRKFKEEDNIKIFISLVTASAAVSVAVGIYTDDIFNALSIYTPLSLISIVVKESLEDRKIKRKYKLGEK
ncbi:hypothetical protein ACWEXX_06425 [Staphylococcus xylosus]|uniref:hypothetical protein n=1 Tax=Staphylococcus xylosus TaxID=1288 RepID=UPI001F5473E2|nr:hypothetical protein [Staphylococcus xylosus]